MCPRRGQGGDYPSPPLSRGCLAASQHPEARTRTRARARAQIHVHAHTHAHACILPRLLSRTKCPMQVHRWLPRCTSFSTRRAAPPSQGPWRSTTPLLGRDRADKEVVEKEHPRHSFALRHRGIEGLWALSDAGRQPGKWCGSRSLPGGVDGGWWVWGHLGEGSGLVQELDLDLDLDLSLDLLLDEDLYWPFGLNVDAGERRVRP